MFRDTDNKILRSIQVAFIILLRFLVFPFSHYYFFRVPALITLLSFGSFHLQIILFRDTDDKIHRSIQVALEILLAFVSFNIRMICLSGTSSPHFSALLFFIFSLFCFDTDNKILLSLQVNLITFHPLVSFQSSYYFLSYVSCSAFGYPNTVFGITIHHISLS